MCTHVRIPLKKGNLIIRIWKGGNEEVMLQTHSNKPLVMYVYNIENKFIWSSPTHTCLEYPDSCKVVGLNCFFLRMKGHYLPSVQGSHLAVPLLNIYKKGRQLPAYVTNSSMPDYFVQLAKTFKMSPESPPAIGWQWASSSYSFRAQQPSAVWCSD